MSQGLEAIFHREPLNAWQKFYQSPLRFIAEYLYKLRRDHLLQQRGTANAEGCNEFIKVVCLSDTHNHIVTDVPFGDILIHAGDLTERGTAEELNNAIKWLQELPHKYKVVIAGNHELCLDKHHNKTKSFDEERLDISWGNIRYLKNSSVILDFPEKNRSIKVYGSPYTPKHGNWAFQYPRELDVWGNTIPIDTDILVTHGPPRHHLDIHAGCHHLLKEIWRVRPKLHVFGHIHVDHGQDFLEFNSFQKSYERLCSGEGYIFDIMIILWLFLFDIFAKCLGLQRKFEASVLVNASMVHGLMNEELNQVITQII